MLTRLLGWTATLGVAGLLALATASPARADHGYRVSFNVRYDRRYHDDYRRRDRDCRDRRDRDRDRDARYRRDRDRGCGRRCGR